MNHAAYREAEQKLFAEYDVDVQEHLVDLPDLSATTRVLELGSGDPLIFIHGSPNTAASWISLAANLTNRRCLLIERPGAGLSTPVKRWKNHKVDSAYVVKSVVEHFDLEKVDLVGSSFSGFYSYNFAMAHPDCVNKLVITGSPGGPQILGLPKILRILSLPIPSFAAKKALRVDTDGAKKMYGDIGHQESIDSGAIPEFVFEWYSALTCNTNTFSNLLKEIRAIATPFGYRKTARINDEVFTKLGMPTLYLWGDNDVMATPVQADALSALTPSARIEHFESFGHLPWYDDANLIGQRIEAFLTD